MRKKIRLTGKVQIYITLFSALIFSLALLRYISVYISSYQILETIRYSCINLMETLLSFDLFSICIILLALFVLLRALLAASIVLGRVLKTVIYVRGLEVINVGERFTAVRSNEPLAFVAGIINPTVYISQSVVDDMTPCELEAVLIHEEAHIQGNALLWDLASHFFEITFMIRGLRGTVEMLNEFDADNTVIEKHGSAVNLARALLIFSRPSSGKKFLTVSFGGAYSSRVENITSGDIRGMLTRVFVNGLLLILLSFSLSIATLSHSEPTLAFNLETGERIYSCLQPEVVNQTYRDLLYSPDLR